MRSFHFPGRSPVVARNGMAATSHPAASLAAIEVLKRGGNAVDAAITATALLGVVEPAMTGIGGDCFALLHVPKRGLVALNASGHAPAGADAAMLGLKEIAVTSPHAVTVPGAIDGWARLLSDFGTISLAEALAPAIEAAEGGFAVAPRVAHDWAASVDKLRIHEGARRHLLKEDGKAPITGDVFRMPALARTMRIIARDGRAAFYEGELAAEMVAELRALGGKHTLEDFRSQSSHYVTPLSVKYGPAELFELPPNGQGIVALIVLKLLERIEARRYSANSPERYHLMLEAARLGYTARDAFVADPATADVPVSFMLSDDFIATLAKRISVSARMGDVSSLPRPVGSDTVYLTVADRSGMVVSFINSLFVGFGSGIVTRESGIALHNRGCGFSLDPGSPNLLGPRKRPLHTLVPAMAMRDGRPWLSFGVMGGMLQPVGHAYVLTNMVDYGLDVQEAIDHPRVFFDGGKVLVEETLPEATRAELRRLGHDVGVRPDPWGGGQSIEIDHERGVFLGGSDARKDGAALGY